MTQHRKIDDCLTARGGHLFIEEVDAVELVKGYGSPVFVLSEDQIRRNVRRFQDAFQAGWPHGLVKILPAAKANWISAVQRILADEGCGCDIYSPGELSVALNSGFDPLFISVNGVPKFEEHIQRCVREGVRITIDSVEEVDKIERAAVELGKTAKVRLRLKPAICGFVRHSDFVAEGLVSTDIAALVYKGGLAIEQILDIGPRIMKMKNVELVGFHEHHGRHHPSLEYWKEQMISFARDMGEICKALGGFQPQEIDIGGGFPIPRDPFNAMTRYSDPLQLGALYAISGGLKVLGSDTRYRALSRLIDTVVNRPNQKLVPQVEEYAEVCTSTLARELPKNGISIEGLMLQVEPGRAVHGNAGIHLTTVRSVKRMSRPIRWTTVIVDTTEFWFTGGRLEHHLHDYVFANKTEAEMTGKADIDGRSCYGDRLLPSVPVPDIEVGDILAVLDAGAYQEVSMNNFNAMPRPATLLVTGDEISVIRRAEEESEIFRRDVIPEHLGKVNKILQD